MAVVPARRRVATDSTVRFSISYIKAELVACRLPSSPSLKRSMVERLTALLPLGPSLGLITRSMGSPFMKKPSGWCDREGWISQDASHLAPTMFPSVGLGTTIKRFNWSLESIHYGYTRVGKSRRKRSRVFSAPPIRARGGSRGRSVRSGIWRVNALAYENQDTRPPNSSPIRGVEPPHLE